jgi:hypothetical protein
MSGHSLAPITEGEPPNFARGPDGGREGAPPYAKLRSRAMAGRQCHANPQERLHVAVTPHRNGGSAAGCERGDEGARPVARHAHTWASAEPRAWS